MSTAWQTNEGGTDVLRFERREIDRWPVHGIATAFRLGGDRFGEMHELSMLDYSHDGLGCACTDPIEPGTVISLGFQAPGYTAKRGTVVQCVPTGSGYRIGIRFENMLAA